MVRSNLISLFCLVLLMCQSATSVDVDETILNDLIQRIENVEEENRQLKLTVSEFVQRPCKSKRFVVDSLESPVAFTAAISKTSISNLNPHQTILFETTMTDIGGAYNNVSGIFVAPRPGVYVFSCSLLDHDADDNPIHAEIVKGGNVVLGRIFARGEQSRHRDQGAQSIVTHLKAGDQVWIRVVDIGNISVGGSLYSTFTGYLLYAD